MKTALPQLIALLREILNTTPDLGHIDARAVILIRTLMRCVGTQIPNARIDTSFGFTPVELRSLELLKSIIAHLNGSEQLNEFDLLRSRTFGNFFQLPGFTENGDLVSVLTLREREVLAEIAEGLSNKEIASKLGFGVRTAETHRERIMKKLDIHTVAELTKFALAHGLSSNKYIPAQT